MDRTARVQSLELGWWDVAERLVQAGGVEPGDVLDDPEFELGAAAPDAVDDQLGLEVSRVKVLQRFGAFELGS